MPHIEQYKFRMRGDWIDAYKGQSLYPYCLNEFKLDTTDKTLFDKVACFPCFMKRNNEDAR